MNKKYEKSVFKSKNKSKRIIKVAILAEEPLGWGSGKHYFPAILNGYTWNVKDKYYIFSTKFIYDKDILKGKLNIYDYDVLLVPGGGVGDGEAIVKGFNCLRKVKKWKKQICNFIKDGGGYVGICGGTALLTDLITENRNNKTTFLERLYNKSSLGISCVKSYYKNLSLPIFNLNQGKYPEKIGAMGYVFSFSPGETQDGKRIHTGGVPMDIQICKDNPIFSDFKGETKRIRWWGGPALILPEKPDREVKILAKYPKNDLSENDETKIKAWKYKGGIYGLLIALLKSLKFIKNKNESFKKLLMYIFFLSGDWKSTERIITLDYNEKPCMTAEIYPNENKGRILLCTTHPEYMVWWGGQIEEIDDIGFNSIANGFHHWKNIKNLSETAVDELTHNWWIIRRIISWAAKIPDHCLPPVSSEQLTEEIKKILSKNIFWNGEKIHQMNNI